MPNAADLPAQPEVRITRDFNASPQAVYRAWTDPVELARWFAPTGCSAEFRALDIRPGGSFLLCIRTPDRKECWCAGSYLELIPARRIVLTMTVADASGNPADPAAAGMDPRWPRETTVTITLTPIPTGTRLLLEQTVSEALAKHTGAHPSWLDMLTRLAALLPAHP